MYRVELDGEPLYNPTIPDAVLTEPVLELETGYAGTFTATVPYSHPLYDNILCRSSMISIYRENTEIFYGEVRKVTNIDRYKNKSIYCTGALSFLADSVQPKAEYHNLSPYQMLSTMLNEHNAKVEERKKIFIGSVTVTDPNNSLYRCTNYENTLEAIRTKLVSKLGGYLRLRHENGLLYLDWLNIADYGKYSSQPIEFGLNMLDYSETLTAEDIVTAVIPRGAVVDESDPETRVDITSVNNNLDYVCNQSAVNRFGWVWAVKEWDNVTVPANLKTKAGEYLTTTQYETLTLNLTAADLSELGSDYDAFAEGDRVHCVASPYGMDITLPVMKLTIPLLDPAGRKLELSNSRQVTYTESQTKKEILQKESINENITAQNAAITAAIDNVTSIITGANGGYKLTEYDSNGLWLRDLYMDAPDKDHAVNILQINSSGIAASTTGYAGPYTVGFTISGQIVGSSIAANSIDANKLSVGLNTTIQGLSDGIATKVDKNGVISEINQSSEAVSIDASKINLNGAISANGNVQIDTDGLLKAKNMQISGSLYTFEDFSNDYDSNFSGLDDRGLVMRNGSLLVGRVCDHGGYSDTYGKGITLYTGSQANDNGYNCIHLIPYRLSLFANDIYVKKGESSNTTYKGVTGNFGFGSGTTYRFVNGLMVEEV